MGKLQIVLFLGMILENSGAGRCPPESSSVPEVEITGL